MTTAAVLLLSALQAGIGAALLLRKSSDCAELKADCERLTLLSETDELTGLLNLRAFQRMARDIYPTEKRVGVIVWSINGLQNVNAAFGHAEGDKLLRRFGTALNNLSGLTVRVFRLSGDEFVLVAEGGDNALLDSLLTRLNLHIYPESQACPVPLKASHGCAVGRGCELLQLTAQAEAAMYNSRL